MSVHFSFTRHFMPNHRFRTSIIVRHVFLSKKKNNSSQNRVLQSNIEYIPSTVVNKKNRVPAENQQRHDRLVWFFFIFFALFRIIGSKKLYPDFITF